MSKKEVIADFFSSHTIAIIGVSRNGKNFGASVYRSLRDKGYTVYPINHNGGYIDGTQLYPDLFAIPDKIDGVVMVVPPQVTEKMVKEISDANIKRVWMQQGSESQAAVDFCNENSIDVIDGECILMFAEPAEVPHRVHRWFKGVFGKLPQ